MEQVAKKLEKVTSDFYKGTKLNNLAGSRAKKHSPMDYRESFPNYYDDIVIFLKNVSSILDDKAVISLYKNCQKRVNIIKQCANKYIKVLTTIKGNSLPSKESYYSAFEELAKEMHMLYERLIHDFTDNPLTKPFSEIFLIIEELSSGLVLNK